MDYEGILSQLTEQQIRLLRTYQDSIKYPLPHGDRSADDAVLLGLGLTELDEGMPHRESRSGHRETTRVGRKPRISVWGEDWLDWYDERQGS